MNHGVDMDSGAMIVRFETLFEWLIEISQGDIYVYIYIYM